LQWFGQCGEDWQSQILAANETALQDLSARSGAPRRTGRRAQ